MILRPPEHSQGRKQAFAALVGALAGQIVMEGFVQIRLSPVRRRLLTRGLALVPAVVVIAAYIDIF